MTDWPALRETIRRDRGGWCQACGCAPWTELHHCLLHRSKDHPELDCIENLEAVCSDCHPFCNGWAHRVKFYRSQCALYGSDRMREWLAGVNLKIRPRFD
jgi:hypothetical protein